MEAFYIPDPGHPGLYHPTELTRGPWSPNAQHGGPPSALLGHAIERCAPRPGFRVSHVSIDVLARVPLEPLLVETDMVKSGHSVELVEGRLIAVGRLVMSARAWRYRLADPELDFPAELLPTGCRPGPDVGSSPAYLGDWPIGYLSAIDYRFVGGSLSDPGPAVCWIRLKHPVVAGHSPSPLERVLGAADAASGASGALDMNRFSFMNTDLVVSLHRQPDDEWIGMDCVTHPQRHGVGVCEAALFDRTGPLGRSTQTLFITSRRQ